MKGLRLMFRQAIHDHKGKFVGTEYFSHVVKIPEEHVLFTRSAEKNLIFLPEVIGGEWFPIPESEEQVLFSLPKHAEQLPLKIKESPKKLTSRMYDWKDYIDDLEKLIPKVKIDYACKAVEISSSLFSRWMKAGKDGEECYIEFYRRITEARERSK